MAGVIQISEAASIALHTTLWLAAHPDELQNSKVICRRFGFSEAHFAKVMQALSRAAVVKSVRGPRGGSRLARPADQITLLDVYEAIEGKMQGGRCLLPKEICPGGCCELGTQVLDRTSEVIRRSFAEAKLSEQSNRVEWSRVGLKRRGAAK